MIIKSNKSESNNNKVSMSIIKNYLMKKKRCVLGRHFNLNKQQIFYKRQNYKKKHKNRKIENIINLQLNKLKIINKRNLSNYRESIKKIKEQKKNYKKV